MSTINFENAMFIINAAAGTTHKGILGLQECSGRAEFNIVDCDTDEKLGTAMLNVECYGKDDTGYEGQSIFSICSDGKEIFRTVFNTDDMEGARGGYNRFITDIALATNKPRANVKEFLANACELIGRNSIEE